MVNNYLQQLNRDLKDFGEYENKNAEIEALLEAQLEKHERRIKDLISSKFKLEAENDKLMGKLEATIKQTFIHITELQDENMQMRDIGDEMSKYIKELEESNEDLHRSRKATQVLLGDVQSRLKNATQQNAALQKDLHEKERQLISFQRLQNECRDLKGALAISAREKASLKESKLKLEEANSNYTKLIDTEKHHTNIVKNESISRENKNSTKTSINSNGCVQTISEKTKTLSDVLRAQKLKSKLASCKNYIQEYSKKPTTKSMSEMLKEKLMPLNINEDYINLMNTLTTNERTSYIVSQSNT